MSRLPPGGTIAPPEFNVSFPRSAQKTRTSPGQFKDDIKKPTPETFREARVAYGNVNDDSEFEEKGNLFNWLKPGYRWPSSWGPNKGWPSFCNKPIYEWDQVFLKLFKDEGLRAAKAAYDEYRNPTGTGGKRRKRTKFNKRKSSSRVLSKSRRRTHRK